MKAPHKAKALKHQQDIKETIGLCRGGPLRDAVGNNPLVPEGVTLHLNIENIAL